MKPIEHGNFLLVVVPEGTKEFGIAEDSLGTFLWTDVEVKGGKFNSILPTGNYSLVGMAKDLTEEQWENIVGLAVYMRNYEELVKEGWWNYNEGHPLATATESGLSLLKHHGLKLENTLILSNNKTQ